jgi:hypothetical protein
VALHRAQGQGQLLRDLRVRLVFVEGEPEDGSPGVVDSGQLVGQQNTIDRILVQPFGGRRGLGESGDRLGVPGLTAAGREPVGDPVPGDPGQPGAELAGTTATDAAVRRNLCKSDAR